MEHDNFRRNLSTWDILSQTILYNNSETGWLTFGVCVLLGDGSGGVYFLVSSRSVSYWQRGRFLFGQF
jgi:hypothetical protein